MCITLNLISILKSEWSKDERGLTDGDWSGGSRGQGSRSVCESVGIHGL